MPLKFLTWALLIFLVGLSPFTKGQTTATLDSLEKELTAATSDTARLDILEQLFKNTETLNAEKALGYAKVELQLAKKINDQERISTAYNNLGSFHWKQGNYDTALFYYELCIDLDKKFVSSSNPDASRHGKANLADGYNNRGLVYWNKGDYTKALKDFFNALQLYEELELKNALTANILNNIGLIYANLKETDKALSYYRKAMEIQERLSTSSDKELAKQSKEGLARAYNNIGIIYRKNEAYKEAAEYYLKSLEIKRSLDNIRGVTHTYINLGMLYIHQLNHSEGSEISKDSISTLVDKALHYESEALALSEEFDYEQEKHYIFKSMGDIYSIQENLLAAIESYKKCVEIAKGLDAMPELSRGYRALSVAYRDLGEQDLNNQVHYKNALINYKIHTQIKDSLFNENKSKEIGKLEAKFEFEKSESEKKKLAEASAAKLAGQKARRDNLQYSGILIFIVLLFAGVFFIGKFSIPIRLAEGMIFFSFLLFFEFTLVLLDPYIEEFSSGAPALKLGFNAILAALIFPLHSLFESKLKGRLVLKDA